MIDKNTKRNEELTPTVGVAQTNSLDVKNLKEGIMSNSNIPDGKCKCSVCGVEKPNSEFLFYKTRFTRDGYRLRVNTNCASCRKKLRTELSILKKRITDSHPKPEKGNPCDLCGKPVHKNWQLDHCHETGEFRGWLCKGCNTGLGGIGDSFESVLKALLYFSKFKKLSIEDITKLIEEKI